MDSDMSELEYLISIWDKAYTEICELRDIGFSRTPRQKFLLEFLVDLSGQIREISPSWIGV